MSYKKMSVERTPNFTISSCPSSKREIGKREKTLGLGFKEVGGVFRV